MAETQGEDCVLPKKKKRRLQDSETPSPPRKCIRLDFSLDEKRLEVANTPAEKAKDQQSNYEITPLKRVDTSQSLNNSLQSPADSAYDSLAGKSPWTPSKVASVDSSGCYFTDSFLGSPDEKSEETFIKNEKLSKYFHRQFSWLKGEIEPKALASRLQSQDVIAWKQFEEVFEARGRRVGSDILIKALVSSLERRIPLTVEKIRKAFEEEKCLFLLENPPKDLLKPCQFFKTNEIKTKLLKYMPEIHDQIEPREIIDDLVTSGMLKMHQHTDIMEMDRKEKRVDYLMELINKDLEEFFPKFCNAVENIHPELGRKFSQRDDHEVESVCLRMTVDVSLTEQLIATTSGSREGSTVVKLNIQEDIEKMIVDDTGSPGSLEMETMEIDMMVDDLQLSCIKISLKHLSPLSQLRFCKRYIESPNSFKKWIDKLMKEETLKNLKERNISTFGIEIEIKKPEKVACLCLLSRKDIVQNFSEIEKSIKYVNRLVCSFASFTGFKMETKKIFGEIESLQEQKTDMFLRKILEVEEIAVCLLERELIQTGQKELLNRIMNGKPKSKRQGKVRTKALKKCSSFLQEEVEPRKFMGVLEKLPDSENVLECVMSSDRRVIRCRKFLSFIEKKGQVAVDLFVQALEVQKESYILDVLTSFETEPIWDEKEIRRLVDSLCQKFGTITDEVDPTILRQIFIERKAFSAREFDMLFQQGSRKEKSASILKHVLERVANSVACLDENKTAGINEILRELFIERKVMEGREFDELCKLPSHKKVFQKELDSLLKRDTRALESFLFVLETRYEKLAKEVTEESEKYKPCPRLDMTGGHILYKGSCKLTFTSEPREKGRGKVIEKICRVDRLNHRVDKLNYTKDWIHEHCKQRISSDENLPKLEYKQLIPDEESASSFNESIYRGRDEGIERQSSVSPRSTIFTRSVSAPSPVSHSPPSPKSPIPVTAYSPISSPSPSPIESLKSLNQDPDPVDETIYVNSFNLDYL